MKKQKNKKTKMKNKKKMLGALTLGLLTVSGGFFTLPLIDQKPLPNLNRFNQLKISSSGGLKTDNLLMNKNFDYFEELNKEFSEKPSEILLKEDLDSKNEKNILNAIKENNYKKWIKALENLKSSSGYNKYLDKNEFNILVKLHKNKEKFESKNY